MKVYRLSSLAALAILLVGSTAQADEPGICPQDNGKYRKTSAGTFLITCGKKSSRGRLGPPNPEKKTTFAECIDACAARTGCKSVDYDADAQQCYYLSGSFIPALDSATGPTVHNARRADPPPDPVPAPNPEPDPVPNPVPDPVPDPVPNPDPNPVPNPLPPNPDTDEITITENPKCPGDNGKVFISSDGTYYKLLCNHWSTGSKLLENSEVATYADCMEKCSATVGCNAVSYMARENLAKINAPQGRCWRWTTDSNSADPNKMHDFAYRIDPPPIQSFDFPNELCTTECPRADGMIYSSSYGETFRMDCGKRHGTAYMSVVEADDFRECMETCAAMVPCHSVDYQARTKRCYLGSHHGNPMVIASSFDSAHSMGCANACSEGCCGKGSIANRKTALPKRKEGLDKSCGNEGLAWAMYPNNNQDGSRITYGGDNDPTVVKKAKPYASGITPKLQIEVSNTKDIYGTKPENYQYLVVNHRGYYYADDSGEYSFQAGAVDNTLHFWIGSKAYQGYTRENADIYSSYSPTAAGQKVFKMNMVKGQYYPFRLMYSNSGGPGVFNFEGKAPNGTVIIDGKTGGSASFVQFSCDGTSAPKFPPFGSET